MDNYRVCTMRRFLNQHYAMGRRGRWENSTNSFTDTDKNIRQVFKGASQSKDLKVNFSGWQPCPQ